MRRKWPVGVLVIVLLFFLFNYDPTLNFFKWIGRAIYPIFIGLIIAFILNSPIKFLENTILSSPKIAKFRRTLSLGTTVILLVGIIALMLLIVVPEVGRSLDSIKQSMAPLGLNPQGISSLFRDIPWLARLSPNFDRIAEALFERIGAILPKTIDFVARGASLLFNIFLGLVFGAMIVYNKEKLSYQCYQLVLYFGGEVKAKKIMASFALAADKFSKFLGGQLVEALIFGTICYLVFIILRLPYAALAALIMTIGNLIPMLGGYISGIIAFIFILTVSAEKALIFVIAILILQQVEQLTTYPLIVGRYVGLSSFWILFSVIVGGSLFGFWGLLLAVPIVAFIDNFFRVMYDRKIQPSP